MVPPGIVPGLQTGLPSPFAAAPWGAAGLALPRAMPLPFGTPSVFIPNGAPLGIPTAPAHVISPAQAALFMGRASPPAAGARDIERLWALASNYERHMQAAAASWGFERSASFDSAVGLLRAIGALAPELAPEFYADAIGRMQAAGGALAAWAVADELHKLYPMSAAAIRAMYSPGMLPLEGAGLLISTGQAPALHAASAAYGPLSLFVASAGAVDWVSFAQAPAGPHPRRQRILSNANAKRILKHHASGRGDNPVWGRIAQELLAHRVSVSVIDTETAYTVRSHREVTDWENLPALSEGIRIDEDDDVSILFHEGAHAVPQRVLAELFPSIPWGPLPAEGDSYEVAVYKWILRAAMQEAYAWWVETGQMPDLATGGYLGDNHVVLYSFEAALKEAQRIREGTEGDRRGWDSARGGQLDADLMQRGVQELKPLIDRVGADRNDPLHGYVRRLIQLASDTQITTVEAAPWAQAQTGGAPSVDIETIAGHEDIIRLSDAYARRARQYVNAAILAGLHDAAFTLALTLPADELPRWWGAAEKMALPDLERVGLVERAFGALAPAFVQGFAEDGERIWRAVFEGEKKIDRDVAREAWLVAGAQIGNLVATVARHAPIASVGKILDLMDALDHDGYLREFGRRHPSPPDGLFDQYRLGIEYWLALGEARLALLERNLHTEATRVENMMASVAPALPKREWKRPEPLSPVELAYSLMRIVNAPEAVGGGWDSALRIIGGLRGGDARSHIVRAEALSIIARDAADIPPAASSRLARYWAASIDAVDRALAQTNSTRFWLDVPFWDAHTRKAAEAVANTSGVSPQLKDTGGKWFLQEQRLALWRFGHDDEIASLVADEAQGWVADIDLIGRSFGGGAVFTTGVDSSLPHVQLLTEEAIADPTKEKIEEALGAVEQILRRARIPEHRQPHYARPVHALRFLAQETGDEDLIARADRLLEHLNNLGQSEKAWRYTQDIRSYGRDTGPIVAAVRRAAPRIIERGRFLALTDIIAIRGLGRDRLGNMALSNVQAILGLAQVYEAILPEDWLHAAVVLDRTGAPSALVSDVYARAVDSAEMVGRLEVDEATQLINAIDSSHVLSIIQKDALFTQLLDSLFAALDAGDTASMVSWQNVGIGDEGDEGDKGDATAMGMAATPPRVVQVLTMAWRHAERAGYHGATARAWRGISEAYERMARDSILQALPAFDQFVRRGLLHLGPSGLASPQVAAIAGERRALGAPIFGEGRDFPPMTIESILAGGGDVYMSFLNSFDGPDALTRDDVIAYRALSQEFPSGELFLYDDSEWETSFSSFGMKSTPPHAFDQLVDWLGVESFKEFFDEYPMIAAWFLFAGEGSYAHSAQIAAWIVMIDRNMPLEARTLAFEALRRAGKVSDYLWNKYLHGNARLQEEIVDLSFAYETITLPDVRLDTDHARFLDDGQLVALFEETGDPTDEAWREVAYIGSRHPGIYESDESLPRKVDFSALDRFVQASDLERDVEDWEDGSDYNETGSRRVAMRILEEYVSGSERLRVRAELIAPSAAVALPRTIAGADVHPSLKLAIRVFLAKLPPSVRRGVLRQLARAEETQPSVLLKNLVELVDLPGMGQFMANLPEGMMPEGYRRELRAAEERVPFGSAAEAREVLHDTSGGLQPVAAGKAGEVWRLTLPDGTVQYVKIITAGKRRRTAEAMDALQSWSEALSALPQLFGGVGVEETVARYRARLEDEMDYTKEAGNLAAFRDAATRHGLTVPTVLSATPDVLRMEPLDIKDIGELEPHEVQSLERATGQTIAQMLADEGMLYSDPHGGNVKYARGRGPALIDFGQVMAVDEAFCANLYLLLMGLGARNLSDVQAGLDGLLARQPAEGISMRIKAIVESDAEASVKMGEIFKAVAATGGKIGFALTELFHMVLFWEGSMRRSGAPQKDFITTYLLPALYERYGGGAGPQSH